MFKHVRTTSLTRARREPDRHRFTRDKLPSIPAAQVAMGSRYFKCISLGLGYHAKLIWLCFFGPRLKRIFYKGTTRMEVSRLMLNITFIISPAIILQDRPYIPTAVERRSDKLISSVSQLQQFTILVVPHQLLNSYS